MATVTVDGYEVAVATCKLAREHVMFGDNRPICLDCAAAVGGRRIGLPKKKRGQPCWSCLEMLRDAEAEDVRAAEIEAAMDEEAERQERAEDERLEAFLRRTASFHVPR